MFGAQEDGWERIRFFQSAPAAILAEARML